MSVCKRIQKKFRLTDCLKELERREFLDRRVALIDRLVRSRRKTERAAMRVEKIRQLRSLQPRKIIKQGFDGLGLVQRPRFTLGR